MMTQTSARNVLGDKLQPCCFDPMTGYFRDGFCHTVDDDHGSHTVCAIMSDEFLAFSKAQGNDLCTPRPEYGFPGLKAGDKWCVCVSRWEEAFVVGKAPKVVLESTHERALELVELSELRANAID
ncbi:MAG: DUF2237 domain-containing protein [Rhodocyclaceae bacterium]|nr:DUF2237 domain-containing protein [Rhodocyclaceae bacterium]